MQSYQLPHFPTHLSCVHTALYTDVSESDLLRKRLITASTAEGSTGERERDAVNFAFIEARLITSVEHLRTAVYQAVLAAAQGGLRTKTVHSEIIWALNPSNNISEAMRRYGVSDTTASLVVVRIGGPELLAEDVERDMDAAIKGIKAPFARLEDLTDWTAVKKYHKLGNEVGIREVKDNPERERAVVDGIVVSSVAMKSVMG
ncbi:kinase binding protein CGI-121-domain-containing protein [Mycena albidolilacea]|uniref:EKC/KEOPS complex subunit CGI121 n=1 Tax=Mycena albidolilacea TaxID=1033008 RepID=A0AAD7ARG1_9AGAR|nr:kinase binding protein CGI-121-domain-containing protein [Mycena albidolilacea]